MRVYFYYILILISASATIGCEPFESERLIRDGLIKLSFPCNDSTSQYFFRGKFGEDSICLYDNQFDCYAHFDQWAGWVTTGPTTTVGDTINAGAKTWLEFGIRQFVQRDDGVPGGYVNSNDRYTIRTPKIKANPTTTTDSLVMAYLQPGFSTFWNEMADNSGNDKGLEVYIFKNHYNSKFKKDHNQLHFTTSQDDQTGSYIEIIELELNESGNHVEGHVHLRFKCKMYLDVQGRIDGKYLSEYDGDFVDDFSGEVNMPVSYDR